MNFQQLQFLAKYPFLKETKDYVNSLNLNLNSLKTHPVYSAAMEQGKQRVIDAVNGTLVVGIEDKISVEFSILSYVTGRIFAHATKNKILLERYARGEAQQIFEFLREEKDENIKKIIVDLDIKISDDNTIPFQQYLEFTKNLAKKDAKWKLVNRELESGKVKIKDSEIIPILTEAAREKILEPVQLTQVPKEFLSIAKNLNSLLTERQQISVKEVQDDALAPCIKAILKSLAAGEISHHGMFILATFFINLGIDKEKIVKIFSVFPKFSEEKTRYQIEFLSGEKSAVKYTCPGCDKIKFYGLCPQDCGVKHPLKYYRNRMRK